LTLIVPLFQSVHIIIAIIIESLYINVLEKGAPSKKSYSAFSLCSKASSGHAINAYGISGIDVSEMQSISEHAQKPMVSDITDGYFG